MRYLVLGGTGTVGSAVVAGLLERGAGEVKVLTRSESSAAKLPRGVAPVIGDLQDPDTYGRAFADFDRLFLLNAVAPTELQEGLAAVNEAVRAGAERIVYLSVQQADAAPHVPHFAGKVMIEEALRRSGVPHVILRPSNFHQNDEWLRQPITGYGVYPQPLGPTGVSRVDVRDIADAAVNALTRAEHRDGTVTLGGPDALTGEDCARIWGEALGREVRYAGDDLEAWAAQMREMLPGWMVYDFALMYRLFQEQGLVASAEEIREAEALVGHPMRSFADYARETAAAWQSDGVEA